MSRLSRVRKGATRSTTLSNPAEWLVTALGGPKNASGQTVTVNSALGLAPYWRGVNLLAGAVGMMPLKIYRSVADEQARMSSREFRGWLKGEQEAFRAGRVTASDLMRGRVEAPRTSRPWSLLHDKPNPDMASDEYWSIGEHHLEGWGNFLSWKDYGEDGRIANLWPLDPARFQISRLSDGRIVYVLDGNLDEPFFREDILHIRGLSLDGLVGYSPVQLHRNGLGTAQAQQEFEGKFWENDATPGVTLIHPQKLPPDAVERLRALWDNRHRGGNNRRKTAVLGEGVTVQQMTMPLKDAQYIEGKRMSATEQALILGLPPHFVAGDNGGNSLTYSTVEGEGVNLLKFTLAPRLVRMQNGVSWDPSLMPSNWFAEFETGAVLRSTTKERYEAWAIAPHLTVNEMREMDNRQPIDGGDVLSKSQPVTKPGNNDGGTQGA